ncbi:YqkE family protein [Halobacillus yeomjeoni]|uniref:YqkE family protein n=1 Tax=Halobacillus yeomjeoni TaxID=311194 RepID=A0A931HUJ0_9BACI|nr:YqkE family protein [Halobacillus yeomjeoni]MBH0229779.1 YqkE family protein [Halobacillus yeomjeoni]MCA0982843.1 YqkE family protein [Halobacillus yeomjeoni]
MSKKKQEQGSLGDHLNADVLKKLRSKKSELKEQEEVRQEEERKRRLEEKKRKEANKSFEELLNESDLDWKSYKE